MNEFALQNLTFYWTNTYDLTFGQVENQVQGRQSPQSLFWNTYQMSVVEQRKLEMHWM